MHYNFCCFKDEERLEAVLPEGQLLAWRRLGNRRKLSFFGEVLKGHKNDFHFCHLWESFRKVRQLQWDALYLKRKVCYIEGGMNY